MNWRDLRYTTKGEYLYAFVLDWPGKRTVEFAYCLKIHLPKK